MFDAPTWTPGGDIGFVVRDATPDGSPGRVALVARDGKGYRELPLRLADALNVAWSPDGSRIAISGRDFGSSAVSIWVANADGAGLHRLTGGPNDEHPSWSPDGRQIAFASDRDGHFEIYRMEVDGTKVTRLTTTPMTVANCDPAWSPQAITSRLSAPTSAPGASPPPLAFHRGRLNAGDYVDRTFQPPTAFTLGPGWEGRRTYIDALAFGRPGIGSSEVDVAKLQVVIEGGCVGQNMKTRVVSSPQDVIRWIQSSRSLKTTNVRPVNAGGYSGISADISVVTAKCQNGPPNRYFLFDIGQDTAWLRSGDVAQVLSVDVRGSLVVVLVGGAKADGLVELAAPVLASLQFPSP